jgi:hypothetical protein
MNLDPGSKTARMTELKALVALLFGPAKVESRFWGSLIRDSLIRYSGNRRYRTQTRPFQDYPALSLFALPLAAPQAL